MKCVDFSCLLNRAPTKYPTTSLFQLLNKYNNNINKHDHAPKQRTSRVKREISLNVWREIKWTTLYNFNVYIKKKKERKKCLWIKEPLYQKMRQIKSLWDMRLETLSESFWVSSFSFSSFLVLLCVFSLSESRTQVKRHSLKCSPNTMHNDTKDWWEKLKNKNIIFNEGEEIQEIFYIFAFRLKIKCIKNHL